MSYERTPLAGTSMEDLDRDAVASFLAGRESVFAHLGEAGELSFEQKAARLGLVGKTAGRFAPTPVGLLLFGRLPQLLHPQWGISAVAIDGRTLGDPIAAREDLEGPVTMLLPRALAFVRDHTRKVNDEIAPHAHTDEHPVAAIDEALVNALVHRDLRKPARVAVRLFADRLEIWNPGGVTDMVSDLEDAVHHGGVSMPRNPLLAATARMLGMGEQLGRGLVRIRRAVLDAGSDQLHLRATPRDFLVVLPSKLSLPAGARALT